MIHNLGQYQLEVFVSHRLNSICYIWVITLFVRQQTIWESTLQDILTWTIKACEVIIKEDYETEQTHPEANEIRRSFICASCTLKTTHQDLGIAFILWLRVDIKHHWLASHGYMLDSCSCSVSPVSVVI